MHLPTYADQVKKAEVQVAEHDFFCVCVKDAKVLTTRQKQLEQGV